jgi:hypothetical protein
MASTWKDPFDVFDYSLSFVPDLQVGETIATIVSVKAIYQGNYIEDKTASIIKASPAPAISGTNAVVFWLQGGNIGEEYLVAVVVTTSQGRTYTGVLNLQILEQ